MVNPVHVNPSFADRRLTAGGSDWLWVVTVVMGCSAFAALAWSKVQTRGARALHYLAVVVLTVATIAYFTMASNLGQTSVRTEFRIRRATTRSIFWVRYIQWFINAPLILLMLLLTTGLPLSDIFLTIFMILVTVVMGLVGALTPSSYKWGFFVFGILTLLYVVYSLLFRGLKSRLLPQKSTYGGGAAYTAFIWLLYPVCWGLSDGGDVITVDSEMVFYGVLDLFAGPLFIFTFLAALENLEYDALGLQSGKASDYVGRPVERPVEREKAAEAGTT
ncbi:family A G protein-coupled receptor-like protein [Russula compacta]|nr:family A G protein-coupled receptor-like protein [Russula compacta]